MQTERETDEREEQRRRLDGEKEERRHQVQMQLELESGGRKNLPSPNPHIPLTPQTGGSKSPPMKLQPNRRPQIERNMSGRRAA